MNLVYVGGRGGRQKSERKRAYRWEQFSTTGHPLQKKKLQKGVQYQKSEKGVTGKRGKNLFSMGLFTG